MYLNVLYFVFFLMQTSYCYAVDDSKTSTTGVALPPTESMQVKNNSSINFLSKTGDPAAVYTDDINEGALVLRVGRGGLRIVNNKNSKNIFQLSNDGIVNSAEMNLVPSPGLPNVSWIIYFLVISQIVTFSILAYLLRKNRRVVESHISLENSKVPHI